MKMFLKLFILPLLFAVTILSLVGKLVTNISSYMIGLLLLVIAGCAIFCIMQAKWMELGILAGMGLTAFLFLFILVWIEVKTESWKERLGDFLQS